MAGIFKAYDIRGIYGDTMDEAIMFKIGRAFVTLLKCKTVTVGRDMRPHSTPLFEAFANGAIMQGADVIDLGLATTPMAYFGCGSLKADGGVMITASHNPGEWNGIKMTRAQAVPISGATGIMDIERICNEEAFDAPAATAGTISQHDIAAEYAAHIRPHAEITRPIKIAADMANSMGTIEARVLDGLIEVDAIFEELDGTFPNHEANPLKAETLVSLQAMIREGTYDFGVAFDGDADRVGFVDENGTIVAMDMITALIAQDMLAHEKGNIFYDLRSSWSVKEVIEENGGTALMSRVGHAFIKQQMRDANASFAGELSGHYYFRDNYFTESSSLAVICVANIVSRSGQTLSELIKPIERYSASGEINSEVADPDAIIATLRHDYADGKLIDLDGVSFEYDDWWFNVRMSNTEPLIRLNLEATTPAKMEAKRDEILAIIRA